MMQDGERWPRVAVVVLNWNRPEDTADCLAALREVAYPNLLPILVDNGSTDGSVERLSARFPECTLLANPRNLGYAEGNNVGIRHALSLGSDYVLLLNNDAVLGRDALNAFVLVAESDPSIGVVGPVTYFWDRPRIVWSAGGEIDPVTAESVHLGALEERPAREAEPVDVGYVSGCALMARAELFRQVGLLDGDYFLVFEEADLCTRAWERGYRVVLVPGATARHKVSASFGGPLSESYLYYFHRNNLIYVKKRMRGPRRWRAYVEVLRRQAHYVWQLYRRGQPEARSHGQVVGRAILDFALGRWGEAR